MSESAIPGAPAQAGEPPLKEETYRRIIESAPNAIVLVDAMGTIVLVNAQTEKLFGYQREELTGRPVEVLVPERLRAAHPGYRADFFASPQTRAMGKGRDLFGRRKDGAEIPVEIGLNPIVTSQGVFVLSAIIDLTERKRAAERFKLVVEATPSAIVITDRDGRITLVNAQAEKLFGYARAELVGQLIEILVPERYRGAHMTYRWGYESAPRSRPMGAGRDLFGRRKDGTEFPVEIGLSPFESEDGLCILAAMIDITERKRQESLLREATADLARSNAELEQFAYVASHDLQEPLRAVAGCVQLLKEKYAANLDPRGEEFIQHAVEGAVRMQGLIEDLLAYSRVGTRAKSLAPVECAAVVKTALADLSASIRESRAKITVGSLPTVMADPVQLRQLVQNLVGNSLKFRKEDAPPEIEISADHVDRAWRFRIHDNGIGIEPQYFERIFRVFQRLHTRREYPGSGIGLAICKKIVERLGGKIWVESEPGQGTTFLFTVPDHAAAQRAPGHHPDEAASNRREVPHGSHGQAS